LEAAAAGQRIGYVRVSTLDQNEKRQLEGQVLDRVFTDKASGRDTARPQLTELLRFARDGDTVVCTAWTGSPATSMTYVPSSKA
jgi:DNA invertase Pin-like site-specific DNA recombinase